ncbi:MAG: O-antigen ligase family protein [Phycisphaerales bacterium]|nr:MAG: O-antigen ligase family protein [Phycisphaerales bacterium]
MWPLRTYAFLALFLAACGASLLHPIIGAAAYLMVYQLYPEGQWWGIPLEGLGIRYSQWAATLTALGIFVTAALGRMPRRVPLLTPWEILVALITVVAIAGYLSCELVRPGQTVLLNKFCKMMFFVFCLTHVVASRRSLMVVMWVFVVGSLLLGHDAYNTPTKEFVTGRLQYIGGTDFRASSGFAAHMAAMLPLIGAVFLLTRHWAWRVLALVSGVLTFNAVILCRTRSAFIGLIAGVVTASLLVPRSWRWKVYPALAVAVIGGYCLTDQHFVDRMWTMSTPEQRQQDAAINLRYDIWDAGLRMLADHPMGVGIGNFATWIGDWNPNLYGRASHNTFLLCATELGLPGLFLYLLLIIVSVGQLAWLYWKSDASADPAGTRILAFAFLVSIVMYLAAGQFTERFYTESLWWVLALPTCLERAVRQEFEAFSPVLHVDEVVEEGSWGEAHPLPGG